MAETTIVVFEGDLRMADNPALTHAARGGRVIPVYVASFDDPSVRPPGAAARWWLHHSLAALDAALRARGLELVIRAGAREVEVCRLVAETGASRVFANRSPDPAVAARQERTVDAVCRAGAQAQLFAAALLHDPAEVRTQTGSSYTVFTPFWKKLKSELVVDDPLRAPHLTHENRAERNVESLPLEALALLPALDWADGFGAVWKPGEEGAHERIDAFTAGALGDYVEGRNRPDRASTSMLSAHLAHGEITARQAYVAVERAVAARPELREAADAWIREVGWREFSYHVLHHQPRLAELPLKPGVGAYPWRMDHRLFRAWRRGMTGFPIVDAGMRQLWHTGWMHNRVRMIVASFLTKDLGIDWRDGEQWFWDTLVDADAANNPMGWQWAAGCSADAQPFFRIFNPTSQGERFDPDGEYVRRWIPELGTAVGAAVHRVEGGGSQGSLLGGGGYPPPVVDHGEARRRAMELFRRL
jgi:deoxyribodipyrimidine photo-lyase